MTTAAIILAAGSSSRLGEPKQLLPHDRGTFAEHAIVAALDARCDPLIVVSGAVDLPIDPALASRVTIAHNPDWSLGMGGSIRSGVAKLLSLRATIDRLLILVCDQPALDGPLLLRLMDHWQRSNKPMAACAYADSVGPPCGFDRSQFDALLALPPKQGAKSLLRDPRQIATIDWPAGAADIDTPDDLRRWREKR